MSQYFVTKNDQQIGPISEAELAAGVLKGRFSTNDLVWQDGMKDWQPLDIVFPTLRNTGTAVPPPIKRIPELKKKETLSRTHIALLCLIGLAIIIYNAEKVTKKDAGVTDKTQELQPKQSSVVSVEEPPVNIKEENQVTYSVGESFQIGDFSYVINSVRNSDHIGVSGSDVFNLLGSESEKALMQELQTNLRQIAGNPPTYLIIHYQIKNEGTEPSVVSTTDFKILDSKGRKFTPSSKATTELALNENEDFLFKELQPGIAKDGIQAFELPSDSFDGKLILVVPEKGVFGSKEARVEIDLSEKTERAKQEAVELTNQNKRLDNFKKRMEHSKQLFGKLGEYFLLRDAKFKITEVIKTSSSNFENLVHKTMGDSYQTHSDVAKNKTILGIRFQMKCEGKEFVHVSDPKFQLSNLKGEYVNGFFKCFRRKTTDSGWPLDTMLNGEEEIGIAVFELSGNHPNEELILFVQDSNSLNDIASFDLDPGNATSDSTRQSGFLGVQFGELKDGRVALQSVLGGAAQDSGLLPDDIVLNINSKSIASASEAAGLISQLNPGDIVEITIDRNNVTKRFKITLGKRPLKMTGFLGVQFGETSDSRVRLLNVFKNTPADAAGLLLGDEILKMNSEAILSKLDAGAVLSQFYEGDSLELIVKRDGKDMRVNVVLGPKPAS